MHVCRYSCIHACVCVSMYVDKYAHTCVYVWVRIVNVIHVCDKKCVYVRTYVCMYDMHVCMYDMHVCMYA